MALPSSITNVGLFPDFKNSSIGPFNGIKMEVQDTDSSANKVIGATAASNKQAQSFQNTNGGILDSVDLYLGREGSPTDSIVVDLYSDNAGIPDVLLASSVPVLASTINAAAGGFAYKRFSFLSAPVVNPSTTYWLVARRTGAFDLTNRIDWRWNSSNVYASGTAKELNNSTWIDRSPSDFRFKIRLETDTLYQPAVDKTDNKLRIYKSTDSGHTWAEQDAANAPSIHTTANLKSFTSFILDTKIITMRFGGSVNMGVRAFDISTNTWETSDITGTGALAAINAGVSTTMPALGGFRPLITSGSDYVFCWQGATESSQGQPRRRIKLTRRGSTGVWLATPYDVVGSPNAPSTALPGGSVHYDVRATLMDGNGNFHIFFSRSDSSNIQHRIFKSDITFTTINVLGSTAAVASNTALYSIGLPCNYFQNGEWYVALPYVDSATGTLKVARAKASTSDVASNWTITEATTEQPEVTLSNPCAVISDNTQGSRLWLFFTKADRKLYFTNDNAVNVWDEVAEWDEATAKTVSGLAGQASSERVSLIYQNDSTTPDELAYDELQVAIVRDAVTGGTYVREFDLGEGFDGDYTASMTTADQSGITCSVTVATKADEGSSYQDRGNISNESEGTSSITFNALRLVQMTISVTGGAGTLSVNGFES
jgi:hypothetical protein